jgi:3-dehydroquinate synthetase
VADHLAAVGVPTHIRQTPVRTDADALMGLIAQDKKVKRGKLTFILVRGIGESFIAADVDPAQVRTFLAEKVGG